MQQNPHTRGELSRGHVQRRKASVSGGKWNPELASCIEEKLQATWSLEQIVERLCQECQAMVCFTTVYRWLYTGRLVNGVLDVLRHKGKRQKSAETRGKVCCGQAHL